MPVVIPSPLPPVSPRASASVPPVSRAGSWRPAALPTPSTAPPSRFKLAADPHATLAVRLLPGGVVLASAILVTILDQVYSSVSGEIFTLGGLRTSAVAGLVMLIGIGLCVYRLKRD